MSRILSSSQIYTLLQFYKDMGMDSFLFSKPQIRKNKADDTMKKKRGTILNNLQGGEKEIPIMIQEIRHLLKNIQTLAELRETVERFDALDIRKGANKTVFGKGNPESEVMLIGEAPGAEEDKEGVPFCGRSGQLLENILATIGLNENKYYITNTIFWRPPANRKPTKHEIEVCLPFVEKHIALVKPKIIILVGNTAAESLLRVNSPMNSLRQRVFTYKNKYLATAIETFVIFHPSYLLRQPRQKKMMFYDIMKINESLQ
jgi:DNA polymerase